MLVVSFGLISTDSYYTEFGLRYQDIGIPYDHLVYRGFWLPLKQPYFLLIYAIVIVATAYANASFALRLYLLTMNRTAIFYTSCAICMVIGSVMAYDTGVEIAVDDVYAKTTTLRQLTRFHSSNADKDAFVNDFMREKAIILIVRRTVTSLVLVREPLIQSTRPRFNVIHVGINNDDFYSDAVPPFR